MNVGGVVFVVDKVGKICGENEIFEICGFGRVFGEGFGEWVVVVMKGREECLIVGG